MKPPLPHPRNPLIVDDVLAAPIYDAFTVSLLHFNEAHGSLNIYDEIATKTWSPVGDTQIDQTQSVFGGSSIKFDGAGDSLQRLSIGGFGADYQFLTGDFTIDFRVRFNTIGSVVLADWRVTDGLYPCIFVTAASKLAYFVNGVTVITGTTTLVVNTWYHVAVARSGTNTKLFLNGTQEGSTLVDSNNYSIGTDRPIIGANGPLTVFFNGWIDEFRVSKGIARWTANFTPPATEYEPG